MGDTIQNSKIDENWIVHYPLDDIVLLELGFTFVCRPLSFEFNVPLDVDQLLYKWLGLKRFANPGLGIIAFLFLQSHRNNIDGILECSVPKLELTNSVPFHVPLTDNDLYCRRFYNPLTYPSENQFYNYIKCTHYQPNQMDDFMYCPLDPHFPFVLVEIPPDHQYLSMDDLMIQSEFIDGVQFENSSAFKIVPTHQPHLYLLILSQVLETEDDCAKLMRCYANKNDDSAWDSGSISTLIKHLIVKFKNPCILSSTYFTLSTRKQTLSAIEASQAVSNGDLDFNLAIMTFFDALTISDLFK